MRRKRKAKIDTPIFRVYKDIHFLNLTFGIIRLDSDHGVLMYNNELLKGEKVVKIKGTGNADFDGCNDTILSYSKEMKEALAKMILKLDSVETLNYIKTLYLSPQV